MAKAFIFKNIDNEAFTDKWDGIEYTFAPGQQQFFEEGIARKFAKRLIDKMLSKTLPDNEMVALERHPKRAILEGFIILDSIEAKDSTQLMQKMTQQDQVKEVAPVDAVEPVVLKRKPKATPDETTI